MSLNKIADANTSNWLGVASLLFFMLYGMTFPADHQLFVKIETIPPKEQLAVAEEEIEKKKPLDEIKKTEKKKPLDEIKSIV